MAWIRSCSPPAGTSQCSGDDRVPFALRAAGLRSIVTLFAEVSRRALSRPPPDESCNFRHRPDARAEQTCAAALDETGVQGTQKARASNPLSRTP